jgi:hypothetical protein
MAGSVNGQEGAGIVRRRVEEASEPSTFCPPAETAQRRRPAGCAALPTAGQPVKAPCAGIGDHHRKPREDQACIAEQSS